MEILLFVHNYDLYILQGKVGFGYEDVLTSFTQPIAVYGLCSFLRNRPFVDKPYGKKADKAYGAVGYVSFVDSIVAPT